MANDVTHILQAIVAAIVPRRSNCFRSSTTSCGVWPRGSMAAEKPGQTLNATALVHEAYLRLVGSAEGDEKKWDGRGHFFAAAAEAMRRILVENARRKSRVKHGGELNRVPLEEGALVAVPRAICSRSRRGPHTVCRRRTRSGEDRRAAVFRRTFDRRSGRRVRRLPRHGQPPLGLCESLAALRAHAHE